MSNRFTAIPAVPVPPPGRTQRVLLPVADLFMVAMLSRPASGTLRTAWVTPATLGLAVAAGLALAGGAVLLVLAPAFFSPALVAGAALCAVFSIGAAAVVGVGVGQRRSLRRAL